SGRRCSGLTNSPRIRYCPPAALTCPTVTSGGDDRDIRQRWAAPDGKNERPVDVPDPLLVDLYRDRDRGARRPARGVAGRELDAGHPQDPSGPYRSIPFVLVNGAGPVTAAIRPSLIASELADRPVHSVARVVPLPVFNAVPPSR